MQLSPYFMSDFYNLPKKKKNYLEESERNINEYEVKANTLLVWLVFVSMLH